MAKSAGLAQAFYAGGYDISGDVGSIDSCTIANADLNATAINVSAMERLLGYGNGTMAYTGYFNDATGQAHDALSGMPTTDVVETWCPSGTTRGNVCLNLLSKRLQPYTTTRGRAGEAEWTVSGQSGSSVNVEDGVLLTAGAENIASSGSLTSLDENGATGSSSNGGVGYLHITTLGSGTPTILIEDSANNSTWATLLTFTIQAARTSERITVTGNVDRYLRVTATGTFTNALVVCTFRRGTAQDRIDLS